MPEDPIRSGPVYKQVSKCGWFGRSNWKPRTASLYHGHLVYFDKENGVVKGEIDLSQCSLNDIKLMPRDSPYNGGSKSSQWRIAIKTPQRIFIMATASQEDMMEWAVAIDSVVMGRHSR